MARGWATHAKSINSQSQATSTPPFYNRHDANLIRPTQWQMARSPTLARCSREADGDGNKLLTERNALQWLSYARPVGSVVDLCQANALTQDWLWESQKAGNFVVIPTGQLPAEINCPERTQQGMGRSFFQRS